MESRTQRINTQVKDIIHLLEELLYFAPMLTRIELRNLFTNLITLFYKYLQYHEIDARIWHDLWIFIEIKKKIPVCGVEI